MSDLILKEFLERNRKKTLNIHCVGDAMIDEYYMVKVNRLSPEHPVPIMTCQNEVIRKPGGAANVANQLKHLNCSVNLICFYDHTTSNVFTENGINRNTFSDDAVLPIKRRYLDNGIQVGLRHDIESSLCGLTIEQIDKATLKFRSFIDNTLFPNVAIMSDYNKGFFSGKENVIDIYNRKNIPTIVDPKKGPLEKWKGCTIFKPNSKEAEELSGHSDWPSQARFLISKLQCKAVVITDGGNGVYGIIGTELFEYKPIRKINVESVIGAGDCFAAFFALAIGHGFNVKESVDIAWNAGSIYVQRRMNRPIVPAELAFDKIVDPFDLIKRDFKLVFTNGCFDILHKGHIETLKFSKSKGEKLVVALNTDESIKKFKDPKRPVMPLEHRISVLSSLECVDFVVAFDEDTPRRVIDVIKPDVLVKGADYELHKIVGADTVPEVYRAPVIPNVSTTKFLEDYFLQQP